MKDDLFEDQEPSLEPRKVKNRRILSDNLFIRVYQDLVEILKNLARHKTWMQTLCIIQGFVIIWLMVELGQKYEFYNEAVKKPYRYDMKDTRVVHNQEMKSLLDLLAQYKIELEEEYMYSYKGAENMLDVLKKIKKHRAVPALPNKPAIQENKAKRKKRKRVRRKRPTRKKVVKKKPGSLTDPYIKWETLQQLIEDLEDTYPDINEKGR